jgi:hypothetical protein
MKAHIGDKGKSSDRSIGRRRLHPYIIALIVLIVFICLLYTYFFFAHDFPLRGVGSDTYSHLGILRCVREQLGFGEDLSPNMFPYLYRNNNRNGINYVIMALISALPGISNFTALYIFGLLGIVVFFSGLYFMVWSLFASHRVAFLAALLSLVLCSYESSMSGNSYSAAEILANAHYASVLSLGIALILIGLNVRFLKGGSWKQYVLQVILSALALNIHVLTGIEYFLILVILVAVYALKERRMTRRHFMLLSLIPAALVLATLWPLYHWYSIFGGTAAGTGRSEAIHASVGEFTGRMVLFLIGLPFIISTKKERLFLLAWTVAFAIICLSFLAPMRVPYFWRFAFVMRIPLIVGLALGLGMDIWALKRWKVVAVPVILVIIAAFIGVSIWRTTLRFQTAMETNDYDKVAVFIPYAEGGANLLALPMPAYALMGISEYNVASVAEGHAPQEIIGERNLALSDAFLMPTFAGWRELLEAYGSEQVLVPRSLPFSNLQILLNGVRVASNSYADLYLVDPWDLDTAVYQEAPDPELEQYGEENGYIRFNQWADVQTRVGSNIALHAIPDPDDPGDFFLRAESESPDENLLFISRGFIEVDPTKSYTVEALARIGDGDPQISLALYQYAEPSFESVLETKYLRVALEGENWQPMVRFINPVPGKTVDFFFRPNARYVKIGLALFNRSTGIIDVDSIRITPVENPR